MIEGKWFVQNSDITQPLALREAVFARGRDALDAQAQQVVVYREGLPVGTGRLWWQDGGFFAGDIGVLPAQRGQGYGDLLVRLMLYKATTHHAQSLCVVCPADVCAFFARYGFVAVAQTAPEPEAADSAQASIAGQTAAPMLVMRVALGSDGHSCTGCSGCSG